MSVETITAKIINLTVDVVSLQNEVVLWKEKYEEAVKRIKWLQDRYEGNTYDYTVEKVCGWLEDNMQDYASCVYEGEELTGDARISHNLINDLQKAMMEDKE